MLCDPLSTVVIHPWDPFSLNLCRCFIQKQQNCVRKALWHHQSYFVLSLWTNCVQLCCSGAWDGLLWVIFHIWTLFFSSDVTLSSMTLHGYSLLTWKNPGGEWAPQKSAALFIFSSSYCPTWCILWTTFYDKHILKSLAAHSICSRTETKGVKLQVSSSVRKEISDFSSASRHASALCVL